MKASRKVAVCLLVLVSMSIIVCAWEDDYDDDFSEWRNKETTKKGQERSTTMKPPMPWTDKQDREKLLECQVQCFAIRTKCMNVCNLPECADKCRDQETQCLRVCWVQSRL